VIPYYRFSFFVKRDFSIRRFAQKRLFFQKRFVIINPSENRRSLKEVLSMFILLAGGLLVIIIAVVISVVSSVVSAVAADQDESAGD
jgi:ABC-type phosphate transport system permease subunit